ncbi:hypothetical protein EV702DRAFT_1271103 [Suillus placidus]|uniref:Uncharacterized protein n=1 Tax=Suillus placidus TaxID=48579 RepID=A0A9P7CX85_9AGAM|nr:hypothetical protein EV702DRAFT_1271103 [Suillus placidus]
MDGEHVELQIQVIETTNNPIDTIMRYHSTCVMNIITFDAAYSFYPIATFEDRSALKIPGSRHRPDVLSKYIKRGWRVHTVFGPKDLAQPYESPFLPNVTRWVGDRHCWTVPLDTSGVKLRTALSPSSEQFSWDPSTQNGWTMLTKPSTRASLRIPEMDVNLIATTVFRYNYIVPSESLSLAIRDWANSQGKLYHEIVTRSNWTWFDAEIPRFRILSVVDSEMRAGTELVGRAPRSARNSDHLQLYPAILLVSLEFVARAKEILTIFSMIKHSESVVHNSGISSLVLGECALGRWVNPIRPGHDILTPVMEKTAPFNDPWNKTCLLLL